MSRIFSTLAILAVVLLSINLVLGLRIGDFNGLADKFLDSANPVEKKELSKQLVPLKDRTTMHILFGVAGSLVTVLVASITVTYFIGTSRWCREVTTMYKLDGNYIRRADAIKRRTFPWAVGSMLIILSIIVLGGTALPANPLTGRNSIYWVDWHLYVAFAGVVLIAISFFKQAVNISENYGIIQEIMGEVARIRQEHGLDVETPATPA